MLEGPRLVTSALDRGHPLEAVYLAYGARTAFEDLAVRAEAASIPVRDLREGVLEKIGVTRTPQPVLAAAPLHPVTLDQLPAGDVVVAVAVADPGNLGTIVRSVEAAGAAGLVVTGDAVDAHHPRTVRASAGAILDVPVVEAASAVATLEHLAATGRRRLGTAAHGGTGLHALDTPGPCALVVGSEAHGLDPDLQAHLDEVVTIPTHGGESLNVAMAATVLLFERDRRQARRTPAGADSP